MDFILNLLGEMTGKGDSILPPLPLLKVTVTNYRNLGYYSKEDLLVHR